MVGDLEMGIIIGTLLGLVMSLLGIALKQRRNLNELLGMLQSPLGQAEAIKTSQEDPYEKWKHSKSDY